MNLLQLTLAGWRGKEGSLSSDTFSFFPANAVSELHINLKRLSELSSCLSDTCVESKADSDFFRCYRQRKGSVTVFQARPLHCLKTIEFLCSEEFGLEKGKPVFCVIM